ncbi:uncharacterized protein B0I36DRAFT_158872 [Microdochium trichocladiopsis]|uniref:DUF1989 domain-containing protein n=1 Tax=Microdochium trichocladiopsis TaxID=1682393 RepID=A0A9P8Y0D7_9PEZI|nr:uncharacterized protein B0I36DRAFT_158872 [Microdochium trichocladiopsis]KAH7026462.1 hypothetical protein B0I36DRAFT_158872 [Microdochium trichocladiopsis]
MSSPPPSLPSDAERRAARDAKPIPPPVPAYLAAAGEDNPSPLAVDRKLYDTIQAAPRVLVEDFLIPIRSGKAWKAPAGAIVRISTPEGAQVGDLNLWSAHNPRERFWASRTRQLHSTHVSVYDRLWSCLPYMRPLVTIIRDTLSWYGTDSTGGRVHDLLGTGCDPYIKAVLSEDGRARYDYHCKSNLARAVAGSGEFPGWTEADVHDVINIFQVTGLDSKGRYFMNPCPAVKGDCLEFLAEQDVLFALSTCPGGDLSQWGLGSDSDEVMLKCCRPLRVEVFRLEDEALLQRSGWKPAEVSRYRGRHGMTVPLGENQGEL